MQRAIILMFTVGFLCAKGLGDPGLADQTFNEFRVNTVTVNQQADPAVDSNGQGEFIVLWESKYSTDNPWYEVAAQRYDRYGIRIGEEFTINQTTDNTQNSPVVSMKPDGGFIAVWENYISCDNTCDIFARIYDANDVPLCNEFCINQVRASIQRDAEIAMNADGDFMIVWNSFHNVYDPMRYWEPRGRIYNADGVPFTPDFSITTDYNASSEPKVVSNGNGGFIVVVVNEARQIYAYEYNRNGSLIGSPHFLTNMKSGTCYEVHFDSSNRHLTILFVLSDLHAIQFDQHFNELVPATLINEISTCDCMPGGVDQLANGDYLFSWTRKNWDTRYDDFMVRRFSSDFVPLEEEQQINSVSSLIPAYPYGANECHVKAIDPNQYVVVWSMNPVDDQDIEMMAAIGPKTWLGDFDHNGIVDANDFSMMSNYWMDDEPVFDLDPVYGDDVINLLDFSMFGKMWLVGM